MLDMNITASIIDHNAIRISWRPFTVQERKFIDGLQVRYRKTSDNNNNDNSWISSQILHRDTTFYVLSKLEQATPYLIDLHFTSIDQISANIISSKPLLIETPPPAIDDFHFDFHVFPDDVTIDNGRINIELRNIPKPIHKFVNVARIHYQNVKTMESFYNYVNVDDENGKISFSSLLPNTRYKLWIDLYLTNGQVVKHTCGSLT
ncbi:hypothetical protein BLA29_006337 [Euroglyphus maynei]|uniref:Fibronectin type-III domain-containing protein n=1 Tax=Euroglyphus maynei TaxID=6958 RepID=A0A1Y3BAU4_EURMA|nr:hypothetical protein BLA29_006337 [Euroglyphus maynei]